MQPLHTPRLVLEPQTAAHADEMHAVLADPAIYAYGGEPPPTREWLRARYARLEARRSPDASQLWLNWVLRERAGGRAIGYVQATVLAGGRAAIAYELASAHWGRGLALEAVTAMADALVADHGARLLYATLKQANQRSRQLLLRLGFVAGALPPGVPAPPPGDDLVMLRPWPPGALIETAAFEVHELRREQAPLLQALFDANPQYFRTVNDRDPRPGEAALKFDELPPPHLGLSGRWIGGVRRRGSDPLQGVVNVTADLGCAGVWHLGLLLMATAWHGRGAGGEVYRGLEDWVRRSGAQWLRLGVVAGNARAERFWAAMGYTEVRTREGVDTGGRINTLRVMVKPLRPGAHIDDYLAAMPRDRRGADLP